MPLSIFSTAWLSKLKTVFGLTKTQTKFLNASVQNANSVDVASLRFNNLVIGRKYRISGQVRFQIANTSSNAILTIKTGGNVVANIGGDGASVAVSGGIISVGFTTTFTAAATTLTSDITASPNANGGVNGTNSTVGTYLQLEELPNHTDTTDWT